MSIPLHKDFGLNPTMVTCFFCNKETGEIVLLGAHYRGKAPPHMCTGYEPCDTCKTHMAQGITLVEATEEPQYKGQPPLLSTEETKAYPTGKWWVVTAEAAQRAFDVTTAKGLISPELAKSSGLYNLTEEADDVHN